MAKRRTIPLFDLMTRPGTTPPQPAGPDLANGHADHPGMATQAGPSAPVGLVHPPPPVAPGAQTRAKPPHAIGPGAMIGGKPVVRVELKPRNMPVVPTPAEPSAPEASDPAKPALAAPLPDAAPQPVARAAEVPPALVSTPPLGVQIEPKTSSAEGVSTTKAASPLTPPPAFTPIRREAPLAGLQAQVTARGAAATARPGLMTQLSNGRGLNVPLLGAYVFGAVCLAGVVLAWWGGYAMGGRDTKQRMNDLVRNDTPPVANGTASLGADGRDASSTSRSPSPQPSRQTQSQSAEPSLRGSSPTPSAPVTQGGVVFPALSPGLFDPPSGTPASAAIVGPGVAGPNAGWYASEPRQAGLNYLKCATLSRDDAGAAVLFLGSNGVHAFATPAVDSRSGSAKNRGSPTQYHVWVGPGQDRDGLRARGTSIRDRVIELGRSWAREGKGVTDFRDPFWDRFDAP